MVMAVLSVLMGILLPSLASVRQIGQQMASNNMQRQLVSGLLAYAASNDEWIPGVNTSGLRLWAIRSGSSSLDSLSRKDSAPVQNTDWISPVMGAGHLPLNREHRFYKILDQFSDPAMPVHSPVFAGGRDGNQQMADWIETNAEAPARGVSFLMSMNFQLYPGRHLQASKRGSWLQVGQANYAGGLLMGQTMLPTNYAPKVTRVGNASRKIAFADGFRYLDSRRNTLDFDAAYAPYRWGSFAERTPMDMRSRSWGRRGGGGDGDNIPLVYRHSGKMDAAFWDGHVQMLGIQESRNPVYWTPSGSTFVGGPHTDPDSLNFGIEPTGSPSQGPHPARSIVP